jgi:hypothetical protein
MVCVLHLAIQNVIRLLHTCLKILHSDNYMSLYICIVHVHALKKVSKKDKETTCSLRVYYSKIIEFHLNCHHILVQMILELVFTVML